MTAYLQLTDKICAFRHSHGVIEDCVMRIIHGDPVVGAENRGRREIPPDLRYESNISKVLNSQIPVLEGCNH